MHYSKSLSGPWQNGGRLQINSAGMPPAAGRSNPAPYIFPNGTVLMLARGKDAVILPNGTRVIQHNVFLYRAPSWNSTYEWVPGNGVNGSALPTNGKVMTEDPVLYRGRRGFHVLLHSHPDLTHGWSEEGLQWHWSPEIIGPPRATTKGDNERPRVMLDADGDLAILFVGQQVEDGDTAGTYSDAARTSAFSVSDRVLV